MILIINTCKEELHYYEFVKPIEDLMKDLKIDFKTIKSNNIKEEDFKGSEKIIITGTSLKDFNYEKKDFSWIRKYDKPILGICAGMQIICKAYGCDIKKIPKTHIGLRKVLINENFLGVTGNIEVYCLHNNSVKENKILKSQFKITIRNYDKTNTVESIQHLKKPIYATLFHPEVKNKNIIENFLYM